jgi:hypothetical protein
MKTLLIILILSLFGCQENSTSAIDPEERSCNCTYRDDALDFETATSFEDPKFKTLLKPIDSVNAIIDDARINPFEFGDKHILRKFWWHNGHLIKVDLSHKFELDARIHHNSFYIFNNCNGAVEFSITDTLKPAKLIQHNYFFYRNRVTDHLFVRSMKTSVSMKIYINLDSNKFAQSEAGRKYELFQKQIELFN